MIVMDASITLAWLFEDERSSYTEKILTSLTEKEEAYVPSIWSLEVSNVLLMAEKRDRITKSISMQFLEFLRKLPIHIERESSIEMMSSIIHMAREYDLTAYDTAYLNLAARYGYPLASLDKKLIKASENLGITH